jgi:hypothetical protein
MLGVSLLLWLVSLLLVVLPPVLLLKGTMRNRIKELMGMTGGRYMWLIVLIVGYGAILNFIVTLRVLNAIPCWT